MENYYDILEVSKKASKEIIDKAYRTLAKKYHPDLQTPENKQMAEEKMKIINEAYSVLSDDSKRAKYDKELEESEQRTKQVYYDNNQQNDQYNNQNTYNDYNYNENNNNYDNSENNYNDSWQYNYQRLSKKEQAKLRRKLEKDANLEYRKQYEQFFRNLGFRGRIKHKVTLKDIITIILVLIVLAIIFLIMWVIPFTHDWMINLYNDNIFIRIIVNILIGIFNGIVIFFRNLFNG